MGILVSKNDIWAEVQSPPHYFNYTLIVDTEFNISGEESHIRVPAADRSGEGDSWSRNGGGGDGGIAWRGGGGDYRG